jgi:AraC-like DNA-binding protein
MRYVEIPPTPPLAPWVECLWALEAPAPAADEPDEHVLPDGCMEIVFHVGAPFHRHSLSRDDGGSQHRTAVVGQLERAIVLRPTGVIGLVGARLRPEGAAALLGASVHDLTGTSAHLDSVWERECAEIEEHVYGAGDVVSALDELERCLLRRAASARAPHAGLVRAVALARTTGGATDVAALSAVAGSSTRQLERRFRSDVGLSPKRFLRVLRVHRAARLLREGGRPLDVALACGYFDEPHLHRDFRDVAGAPPGRWLATEHEIAARLLG